MNSTMWIVKRIVFLSFLALVVTGSKPHEEAAAAKILSIQGIVQITRPDSIGPTRTTVRLGTGDDVYTGDIIRTTSEARVILQLTDGSQAIISENTTVEIKDVSSSPRTIFNVLKGKTRVKIEKMGGKPNPYRVTTPTTVIAVRGTVFDVVVKDDKTEVYVNEGEVSVTSITLPQEVILTPGNFTRVERNMPPRPPMGFPPQQNDRFFDPRSGGGPGQGRNQGNPPNNGNNPRGPSGNAPNQPPSGNPGTPKQGGGAPPRRP